MKGNGKRTLSLLLVLLFSLTSFSHVLPAYAGKASYQFFVDGKETHLEVSPKRVNGAIYVPLRFVAESLGATVKWEKPRVVITKDDMSLTCAINSSVYVRNGEKFSSKEIIQLSDNRVFVPFRMIGELLGYEVSYTADSKEDGWHSVSYFLHLKSVKDKKVEITAKKLDKELRLSPDGKWGILTDRLGSGKDVYNFYIKDMNSQEIKKVYSSSVFATEQAEWTQDNKVLFGGIDERRNVFNRILMQYSPNEDKIEYLFPASRYAYSFKRHELIFTEQTENERMALEWGKPYLYSFKTKEKTPLSLDKYQFLEKDYHDEKSKA